MRRTAAIFFAVWLSGAACLVCCERGETGAVHADEAETVAKAHAPAASSKHSCCEARVVRPRRVEGRRPLLVDYAAAIFTQARARSDATHRGCCRNSRQTLDAARKPRVADAPDSIAASDVPALVPRASLFADAPQPRQRPPDRGGTHLLNCVLLI